MDTKTTFLSTKGRLRVVLDPDTLDYIPVEGGKYHRRRVKGKTVEFEPISPATDGIVYHGTTLSTKGDKIRGMYETDNPEIISRLFEHRMYGISFVGVDPMGRELVGEDKLFLDLPDGKVQFIPTGRVFKNRAGAEGWKQSKEFQSELEKFREKAAREISNR